MEPVLSCWGNTTFSCTIHVIVEVIYVLKWSNLEIGEIEITQEKRERKSMSQYTHNSKFWENNMSFNQEQDNAIRGAMDGKLPSWTGYTPEWKGKELPDEGKVRSANGFHFTPKESSRFHKKSREMCPTLGICTGCMSACPVGYYCNSWYCCTKMEVK
jgi:hypothetical protein